MAGGTIHGAAPRSLPLFCTECTPRCWNQSRQGAPSPRFGASLYFTVVEGGGQSAEWYGVRPRLRVKSNSTGKRLRPLIQWHPVANVGHRMDRRKWFQDLDLWRLSSDPVSKSLDTGWPRRKSLLSLVLWSWRSSGVPVSKGRGVGWLISYLLHCVGSRRRLACPQSWLPCSTMVGSWFYLNKCQFNPKAPPTKWERTV